MAGGKGENSKKVAGNARKADAAASKAAAASQSKAKAEEEEWGKGAKSNAKKEAADAKKAEAARKKAEKDALAAEEEKSLKSAKAGVTKQATKKTKGFGTLDLGALDDGSGGKGAAADKKPVALNATGIDDALDALAISGAGGTAAQIDRHPERRYKAAYTAYETRRMPELEVEMKGLRRQQRLDLIKKEFEKSPENPFNQSNAARFDVSKEEIKELKERERERLETRLAGK
ncbi:MAG: hypothetical protein M1838_005272 [Thelocarpon superellum]|nr:MAG: hypothetical protein M1838_005272 [Thelocarpon superellum]